MRQSALLSVKAADFGKKAHVQIFLTTLRWLSPLLNTRNSLRIFASGKQSNKEKRASVSPSAFVPEKPRRIKSQATRGIISSNLVVPISLMGKVEAEERVSACCCWRRETRTTSPLQLRKTSTATRRREERNHWSRGSGEGAWLVIGYGMPRCSKLNKLWDFFSELWL